MPGSSGPRWTRPSLLSDLQVAPYNAPQMGQQLFRSSYAPLLNYVPFVQPNFSYPQRTPAKLPTNPRDPSAMAGDGPQFLFPQPYG